MWCSDNGLTLGAGAYRNYHGKSEMYIKLSGIWILGKDMLMTPSQ